MAHTPPLTTLDTHLGKAYPTVVTEYTSASTREYRFNRIAVRVVLTDYGVLFVRIGTTRHEERFAGRGVALQAFRYIKSLV